MSDSAQSSDANEDLDRLYRDTGGKPLPTGGVWAAARARRAQRILDANAGQLKQSLAVFPCHASAGRTDARDHSPPRH